MTAPPSDIRRFEALQVASIILGLLHEFARQAGGATGAIVSAAALLTITLLVSRRGLNWARWLSLFLFVFGTVVLIWVAEDIFELGLVGISLALAGTAMQAVALAFSFTRQSSEWLRSRRSRMQT